MNVFYYCIPGGTSELLLQSTKYSRSSYSHRYWIHRATAEMSRFTHTLKKWESEADWLVPFFGWEGIYKIAFRLIYFPLVIIPIAARITWIVIIMTLLHAYYNGLHNWLEWRKIFSPFIYLARLVFVNDIVVCVEEEFLSCFCVRHEFLRKKQRWYIVSKSKMKLWK